MLKKYAIDSQPYIGVFAGCSEELCIIPHGDSGAFEEALETPVVTTTIGGTRLIGALLCMNSNGVLVSDIVDGREIEPILEHTDVTTVPESYNALGNNILVNDKGALLNPRLSKKTEEGVKELLDVEVERGTIAGMDMVGSIAVVTNKGGICHPHATDEEIETMEDLFDIEVAKSTANHGSGWLGTCLIGNTKGAVIGDRTTPIELGRIEEGLKYLE
ncbi:MAG: translation initiation factor IF-6 [Thermoplasmatota archaeon]